MAKQMRMESSVRTSADEAANEKDVSDEIDVVVHHQLA
jgi:hypothetical protein